MKLIEAVKGLVQNCFDENTRPSSNQKDALKLRRGSSYCEPHNKHFLDMKKRKLYERFKNGCKELNLGQIYFEKCKP